MDEKVTKKQTKKNKQKHRSYCNPNKQSKLLHLMFVLFFRCCWAVANHDFAEAYNSQAVVVQYPFDVNVYYVLNQFIFKTNSF